LAQLDRFFEAMCQRGALGLALEADRAPVFSFADGPQPAGRSQPTAAQLLALLGEVVEAEALARLTEVGRLEVELRRPGLPPLRLVASAAGDRVEATVTPKPAAHPAAATAPAAGAATPARTFPIDELFHLTVARRASDLHLSTGEKPILRVDGAIERIEEWPALTADEVRALIEPIAPPVNREEYAACHDTDFAYALAGVARFRANFFADRKGPGAVFRQIPAKILTAEELGLSPAILDLCRLTKGLVLVTGPTGSGKSTTLTALLDHVNTIRHDHVITIEDPIEFVHESRNCLINQREVGTHTTSFKRALRAALREDPDIVLVGELRDLETIAIAIETAETGHLVFATLHTTTAISTVDRLIDQFPPEQQAQVRTMLSESLRGVIAQNLCRKIGGGRVAALEVLVGTPPVANLIREGKTFQLPSIMQTGKKFGMVMLNDALLELVKRGLVEPAEAHAKAVDRPGFANQLKVAGIELGAPV